MVRHGLLTNLSFSTHVATRKRPTLAPSRYYEFFLLYSFIKGDYFPALATIAHGTIMSAIPNMFGCVL